MYLLDEINVEVVEMRDYQKDLLNKIEFHRNEMMKLANQSSIETGEVLEASSSLDLLINEYQRYMNKKNHS